MMVATKSLQILTAATPLCPLPNFYIPFAALTFSTQVPATLSVLGHPLPRQSSPLTPLPFGHMSRVQ